MTESDHPSSDGESIPRSIEPDSGKTVHTETVTVGDDLPCRESNILHTEGVTNKRLRIWYVG